MVDLNNQRIETYREDIELLYRAYRAFTSRADRLLDKSGLNRAHHRILYFVGKRPGLSVSELLQDLAISKQAVNTPLRQLVSMKLVTRQADAVDRRVKRLTLSASGRRLELKLSGLQATQLQGVLESSGARNAEAWRSVMKSLADSADG